MPHNPLDGSLLISAQANNTVGITTTAASPALPPGTTKLRFISGATWRSRHSESSVRIDVAERIQA